MSALLAGLLTSGILGIGKAAIGAVQTARGNRQMKSLLNNRPQYSIPEAYMKSLGLYQQMASQDMPGKGYYENLLGETTARAQTNAERGAISSNVLQGSVENSQDKELQALQQLAKMNAEYKVNAMQGLAGAENQMGQLQDQAWNYNTAQPYDIKLNMANERRQSGVSNLFTGLGDMGAGIQNFIGTKYYTDMLKGLYDNKSQTGNGQQVTGQAFSNMVAPQVFKYFPK